MPRRHPAESRSPPFVIETDLYRVTFSNQGANVRSWLLKKYKGNDNKPLELVNTASGLEFPFSLYFPAQKPATDVNWAWYTQTPIPTGWASPTSSPTATPASARSSASRRTAISRRSRPRSRWTANPCPHMIEWRGGFGDLTDREPVGQPAHPVLRRRPQNKLRRTDRSATPRAAR